jgi:hypothetical protein
VDEDVAEGDDARQFWDARRERGIGLAQRGEGFADDP